MYNPYNFGQNGWQMPYMPQTAQPVPEQTEVKQVNGEKGVDAFPMAPRSSILLLDMTAPLVWLVQTDDAGFKTKTPYSITPYVPEPLPDKKDLDEKFSMLEQRLKVLEEALK